MNAIVNIGLVLQRIREKNCARFWRCGRALPDEPEQFQKACEGRTPRLDALQRICRGLGITEQELIVGMVKQKPPEPAEVLEMRKSSA